MSSTTFGRSDTEKPAYLNPDLPVEKRVRDLLERMTLEEKIKQMQAVESEAVLEDGRFSLKKAEKSIGKGIGGLTRLIRLFGPKEGAELANEAQRFVIEHTRLGIPIIIHEECLHGCMARGSTNFPQAIALGSTWDPNLIEEIASVIAKETRVSGMHQCLSPVLDVVRDPRWGRTEETFGEDPYLVSRIGVAYIKGLQGEGPCIDQDHVIATVKHFAVHGDPEGGHNWAPVHAPYREVREIFLPPFEKAIKEAKAGSVMSAYSEVDGVPCTANPELLTKILRWEWGFQGFVVSDYRAIPKLYYVHYIASTKAQAAKLAVEAGVDMDLPEIDCYGEPLLEAVKAGEVSEATIDQAVSRILKAKFLLGLFEHPYVAPDRAAEIRDCKEHRSLALQAARKAIVLLKNSDNLLPLDKNIKSVAVIGPNADEARLGGYSGSGVRVVTILEGIKNKVSPKTKIHYAKGCDIVGTSTEGIEEAVEAAKKSDVAIVVVGGSVETCREGRDRADLNLSGAQLPLIKAVYETGTPVVVVLINGRPLTINWTAENVPAILEGWYLGEEGGNAVADVLFGDYNPGGKLPITFPRTVGQLPVWYNYKPSARGDSAVGKRGGKYVFTSSTPLFPFGYGLSYTKFEYSNLQVEPKKIKSGAKVEVSVDVRNTGDRKGDEVVQLYIHDIVASVTRPVKELKGFKRITLEPGGKKTVSFTITPDQLAFYDRNMQLIVEPGIFEVMVGSSSEDICLKADFEVLASELK